MYLFEFIPNVQGTEADKGLIFLTRWLYNPCSVL